MSASLIAGGLQRRFAMFATAGAVGTAAHYAALLTLVEVASLSAPVAAGAGAAIGAAINYALNYKFTFRSNARHTYAVPRFALIAGIGLVLSWGIVSLAMTLGIHYLIGQAVATILVLFIGFLANHFWTFSGKSDDHTRHE